LKFIFPAAERLLSLARRFNATGIKLSVNEREALERLGLTPLSNSPIDRRIGKRRQAKALQRLSPILMSKLNAIGFEKPG
jgi:hypothetical protein